MSEDRKKRRHPKRDRSGLITQYAIPDQLRTVMGTQAAFPSQTKSILDPTKYLNLTDIPSDLECLERVSFEVCYNEDLLLLRSVGYFYKLPWPEEMRESVKDFDPETRKATDKAADTIERILQDRTTPIETRKEQIEQVFEAYPLVPTWFISGIFFDLDQEDLLSKGLIDKIEMPWLNEVVLKNEMPFRISGKSLLKNHPAVGGAINDKDPRLGKLGAHVRRCPKLFMTSVLLANFEFIGYPVTDPFYRAFIDKLGYAQPFRSQQPVRIGFYTYPLGKELTDYLPPNKVEEIESKQDISIIDRISGETSRRTSRSPFARNAVVDNSPLDSPGTWWDCGSTRLYITPSLIKGPIVAKVYWGYKTGDLTRHYLGAITIGKPETRHKKKKVKNSDGTFYYEKGEAYVKYSGDQAWFTAPLFQSDYIGQSSDNGGNPKYGMQQAQLNKALAQAATDEARRELLNTYYHKLPEDAYGIVLRTLPALGLQPNSPIKGIPQTSPLSERQFWRSKYGLAVVNTAERDGRPSTHPVKILSDLRGKQSTPTKQRAKKRKKEQAKRVGN